MQIPFDVTSCPSYNCLKHIVQAEPEVNRLLIIQNSNSRPEQKASESDAIYSHSIVAGGLLETS